MEEQQQSQQVQPPQKWQAMKAAVGSLAAEEIVNFLAHGGNLAAAGATEAAIFGGAMAALAGWNAPPILKWLRENMHGEELEPFRLLTHREPGKRSLLDRLLDRYPGQEPEADQEDEAGKSTADEAPPPVQAEQETGRVAPAQFRMESVVDVIARENAKGNIYFGHSASGPVSLPIRDIYHILDVSKSGKGKSNRFRLWMTQLVRMARVIYLNPFASPVKAVADDREVEVWQPLYSQLLAGRPMTTSKDILDMLNSIIKEIDRRHRRELQRDFRWNKSPVFVFIDELPEIYATCKGAPELLDRIARGGRQFCVFAIVASQTALVKDIGLSTGSQAQFKTLCYGGGDFTSSNRIMGGELTKEDESMLKRAKPGLTFLASENYDLQLVRAPLVTNEAMFRHLGLPAFRLSDWNGPLTEELPVYTTSPQENAFTGPVYTPVNGSTSALETTQNAPRLRLLETPVNVNTEQETPTSATVNVNAETRKMIRRMVDEGIPHRKIAKIVGIYGPKYDTYKQVCQEEGIKIEKEA